ncbi:MAG: alpha/beta hydrolase [Candidatus Thermoplasmatota archaeon]|nr:alpha/beta hydrolase [Candidatus Thermoplasmatota archaeon]
MLVFVHGMLSNADVWHPVIDYFNERGFSCKAVNLKEGLDLRKVHFQDYVDKVKAVVTENDIVIGHSMGGLIVQKVAEEASIKGGVAICSAAPKGVKFHGDIVLSSAKYAPKVIMGKPFKEDYPYVRKYMLVGVEEEEAKNIYEKLEEQSAIVTHELGRNKIAVDEKKVKCPLLFIATKKDRVCSPELVKRIAEKYNAEYRLYDGCHHFFVIKIGEI